ncbi:MAG: hypothetical protein WB608_11015 [Terracidiphilus sp.]
MKWLGWALLLLMAASPAAAVKKITVQQLKDLLVSLQQANKTDAEVASELMQVELTEELTRSTMNDVANSVPGPQSSVQMYVLEIHSAELPPPASNLPSTPVPDVAAQKAILDKAIDYATTTYAQLPHLSATKTTLRFEEEWPKIDSGTIQAASQKTLFDLDRRQLGRVIRFVKSTDIPVDLQNGAEHDLLPADKTHWGENGQITLLGQEPALANVVKEAQVTGKIDWLRWETVNGVQTAVYAFAVGKKETHYAVDYCCFRQEMTEGIQQMHSSALSEHNSRLDTSSWESRKATVPYHGEIFVDPETGIVVRLVIQADFKPSEAIRQEDQRIDYAPVKLGEKTIVLPVRTLISAATINAKTVARTGGERLASSEVFTKTCNTLFVAEYNGYQLASATPLAQK